MAPHPKRLAGPIQGTQEEEPLLESSLWPMMDSCMRCIWVLWVLAGPAGFQIRPPARLKENPRAWPLQAQLASSELLKSTNIS